jgi:hypothetical protein
MRPLMMQAGCRSRRCVRLHSSPPRCGRRACRNRGRSRRPSVQAQLGRIGFEALDLEVALAGEQPVVHRPELALVLGAVRGRVGLLGTPRAPCAGWAAPASSMGWKSGNSTTVIGADSGPWLGAVAGTAPRGAARAAPSTLAFRRSSRTNSPCRSRATCRDDERAVLLAGTAARGPAPRQGRHSVPGLDRAWRALRKAAAHARQGAG